jgi:hypothetical protein
MNKPAVDAQPTKVDEAQRLFREYHARCFWSYQPDSVITEEKIEWVREGLRRHGGMPGWNAAKTLNPTK